MAESLPSTSDVERHYSLFGVGPAHPLSFEDGVHCACDRCSAWDTFVRTGGSHGQPQYLIPTRSLVHGLANWLISEQAAARVSPLRVLEVGAGDGALARSLRATLAAAGADILVIASDSYDRGLRAVPGMDVFCADVDTALAAFAPVHVVLCAFMPLGHDWTAAFRRTASIRAYILLGEVDQGCCGRPWATWGYLCDDDGDADLDLVENSTSGSSSDDADEMEDEIDVPMPPSSKRQRTASSGSASTPMSARLRHSGAGGESVQDAEAWRRVYMYEPALTPFGAAGWERDEEALAEISREMLCCTDSPWQATRHAKAVVFRRRF